ncbi:hypothetical protein WR25_14322 [Diploscapter pachys]|uniref:Ubiquitin carboxyl-terminal hydrolase n=1 Tax=Diploscapter pachys TaxID=2018661 RepID=A0A2A2KHB5_9BILA|nr:hypothetical protein WR25_14322 [Diploscapter pachys]
MPQVYVKWGKEKLEVDVDTAQDPLTFKGQLFALTGVAPDRQKVMIKGRVLGDDSWNGLTLTDGLTIMMMGSAEAIPTAPVANSGASDKVNDSGEKILPMPCGLNNLGNTCYMNSVVQSLKTIPELRKSLATFGTVPQNPRANMITAAFKQAVNELERKPDSQFMPHALLMTLHQTFPQFNSRDPRGNLEQQDANECFTELQSLVVDGLDSSRDAPMKVRNFLRGKYQVSLKCAESEEEPVQTTSEDFYQISCFLSQEVKYLQTGIKEKMTEEIVKNSPILGRDAKWQKKALISRLPAYISVQLVRFFYKEDKKINAKIMKDVKFPLVLDLCDICAPELQEKLRPMRDAVKDEQDGILERERRLKLDGKDPKKLRAEVMKDGELLPFSFPDDEGSNNSGFYELQAVITHKGRSSNSGHYVAWVRLEEDKWAMCDDEHVQPITSEDVLRLSGGGDWHTAYVLLYGPRVIRKFPELKDEPTSLGADDTTLPTGAQKPDEPMQTN